MDEIDQGSLLLYGPVAARRRTGALPGNPDDAGFPGGRCFALRPNREMGPWQLGWLGSEISLTVSRWARDSGGDSEGLIWKRHIGPDGEKLILAEEDCGHNRHVSWDEVPDEVKDMVFDSRVPPVISTCSERPPLHPNF